MADGENHLIELSETISFDNALDYFDKYDRWSYKDIENFYERVRMALGAVSEVVIPDYYIDIPEKAPFAESYIKSRVKNWKNLNNEQFLIFESIIIYQTAVLLQSVAANKQIRKKSIPTITLQYAENTTVLGNGIRLEDMIEFLISKLTDENVGSGFIGFRVTDNGRCGKRKKGECNGCWN